MAFSWSAVLQLALLTGANAAPRSSWKPDARAARARDCTSPLITVHTDEIRLSASAGEPGIFVLDYGHNVEGFPTFDVVEAEGDTSVFEITYAESKTALDHYMSDGPLPLAAAMETYRVNRYNITELGPFTNRLIQGAFRYQKLNLSSTGELALRTVGVKPTVHTTPLDKLPGFFDSSDSTINDIWTVGARTVQLSEIPKNSVPEFWEVSDEGVLIDSLAPQANPSFAATTGMTYDLDFTVRPLVRGYGFTVLSDTLNSGIYVSVDVDARTISAYVGSTEENAVIAKEDLPRNLTLSIGESQKVHVQVAITDIAVTINGQKVLEFTQTSRFFGSYGLGASFGQRAVFRDLVVTDAEGSVIYSHPLTDKSILTDFQLGTNPASISVDASRRDRIAYAGDLDVAGSAALTSTHGLEFIIGTLDLLGSYQATPGFFQPTAKIQQPPLETPLDVNITGLIPYSWNLATAVAQTYMHTGDEEFATKWGPKLAKFLDWSHSQVLPNGLFNLTDVTFGGDWNYYDPSQAGVITKLNVLYAYALQECDVVMEAAGIDVSVYRERLKALREAIDTQLWSDELGAYYLSEGLKEGFAQDANAIAILAGVNVNPDHSSEKILSTLSTELAAPGGPLAFSPSVHEAGFKAYVSPYASAYHLRAALSAHNPNIANELLTTLWAPMADRQNANYSGCFWETLDQFGGPALGLITSLCHGWGAGPTAELSRFVLGAQPVRAGWAEWAVTPQTIGLDSARGRVPTPLGPVSVSWSFGEGLLQMDVEAPEGTKGSITVPDPLPVAANETDFTVNGAVANGTTFQVQGGKKITIVQVRK